MDLSSALPLATLFFVFGTVLGSFGNVVVYRLPQEKSVGGRSVCPACGRMLGVIDLIPILSFVLLRGRCRTCKARISWQYPLVEAASGLIAVAALSLSGLDPVRGAFLAIILWLLFLIGVIDAKTGFIPDALNMPLVALAILFAVIWPPLGFDGPIVAGGFFLLQWLISRGRWVGSGDIILGVGIGFLLRFLDLTVLTLIVAYILGAAYASVLLLRHRKTLQSAVPFGPFLVAATFIALLFGEVFLERLLWA